MPPIRTLTWNACALRGALQRIEPLEVQAHRKRPIRAGILMACREKQSLGMTLENRRSPPFSGSACRPRIQGQKVGKQVKPFRGIPGVFLHVRATLQDDISILNAGHWQILYDHRSPGMWIWSAHYSRLNDPRREGWLAHERTGPVSTLYRRVTAVTTVQTTTAEAQTALPCGSYQ